MAKDDKFFNFSKEDELNLNPNFKKESSEEEELISFTDNITSYIKSNGIPHVIVQIFGSKNKKINSQEIYGGFPWNPDLSDINSFHLPTIAKKNLPDLVSGREYYALVRTPDNTKLGGVIIYIKKEDVETSDVWSINKKNNENPMVTVNNNPVATNRGLQVGKVEEEIAEQSRQLFKVVFDSTMDRFKKSLEKAMTGSESEELVAIKKEILTLRGVVELAGKEKIHEESKNIIEEKDKKIKELTQQIEYIHQEVESLKGGTKTSKAAALMEVVKGLMEAKELVLPLLQTLGIEIPNLNLPRAVKGVPPVEDTKMKDISAKMNANNNYTSSFKGFEDEDDITLSGFEDNNTSNMFETNNKSSNDKEIKKMSYKDFSTKILTIIFANFRKTDVVADVLKFTKEEVKEKFWSLIKECKMDENTVIGLGLKNPKEFAKKVMENIPIEIIGMMKTNAIGKDYSNEIEETLVSIVSEAAKKAIS
jgi:hypothetical protein